MPSEHFYTGQRKNESLLLSFISAALALEKASTISRKWYTNRQKRTNSGAFVKIARRFNIINLSLVFSISIVPYNLNCTIHCRKLKITISIYMRMYVACERENGNELESINFKSSHSIFAISSQQSMWD